MKGMPTIATSAEIAATIAMRVRRWPSFGVAGLDSKSVHSAACRRLGLDGRAGCSRAALGVQRKRAKSGAAPSGRLAEGEGVP